MAAEGFHSLTNDFAPQGPLMVYQIHGRPAFAYGDIIVQPNQGILVDAMGMLWMDASLAIDTSCYGGCGAACMRECSGENCCMNVFSGSGKLAVGFTTPGDMLAFGVDAKNSWLLTAGAFVAGTSNIVVSGSYGGFCACMCAEEEMFLTHIRAKDGEQGAFLAGGYGMIERHDVPEGKKLLTAAGTFFATDGHRTLDVGCVGGCCTPSCICNYYFGAGGKVVVLSFTGPCTVFTSSRNPADFRRMQLMSREMESGQENKQQQTTELAVQ